MAGNFDVVLVAPGTYVENINFNGKNIQLKSTGGPSNTFLEPLVANEITINMNDIVGPNAEFNGFTVRNGGNAYTLTILYSEYATVKNNIFHSNITPYLNPYAVVTTRSACLIEDNFFYKNGGSSTIYSSNSFDVRIINNTIADNIIGINSVNYNTKIINNIIVGNVSRGVYGSYSINEYNNIWDNGNNGPLGTNGLSTDPMFINPEADNYYLSGSSPCIDAGNPDSIYNDPDGTRADMGAFPSVLLTIAGENIDQVVDHTPTFYWTLSRTSGNQVTYMLEVGTDDDWTTAEMWSTGEVFSGDSTVTYDGLPLVDGTDYYCRLQVNYDYVFSATLEMKLHMNSLPEVPAVLYPINTDTVHFTKVQITVQNAVDNESNVVSYDFELYEDSLFTTQVESWVDVAAGIDTTTTGPVTSVAVDNDYYIRVRSFDGYEHSDWSDYSMFHVRPSKKLIVPDDFISIQSAIDTAEIDDTVYVESGTYVENIDFLGKSIRVISAGGSNLTFLEPAIPDISTVTINNVLADTAEFSGFTVRNGGRTNTVFIESPNATVVISKNIFYDNIPQFVNLIGVVYSKSPSIVRNNLFYNNNATSTIVSLSTTRIINNTLDRNLRGIYSASSSTVLLNNNITNSIEYGIYGLFIINNFNNVWNNGSGNLPGVDGISVDPEYNNPDAYSYFLKPTSPCIDAGIDDPEYNDPDGTRNDIGAYPFDYNLPIPINVQIASETQYNVINHTPTFVWSYFDVAGVQNAYELEVGTDMDWDNGAEMWTTGQVGSSDTSMQYQGSELINGNKYYYRIRVNNSVEWGDWVVSSFKMNSKPTTPILVYPLNTTVVNATKFVFLNSSDPENDILTYTLEIYEDIGLTNLAYSKDSIVQQPDSTTITIGSLDIGKEFWWRVKGFDQYEYSDWSIIGRFETRTNRVLTIPDEYATIQEAIDSSAAGDTLLVLPGTYAVNLNFTGKILIMISEKGTDSTILSPLDTDLPLMTFKNGESFTTKVQGFTFNCVQLDTVFRIDNNSGPRIENNVFTGFEGDGSVIYSTSSFPTIIRNLFYNNVSGTCISIVSGSAVIVNNTIDMCHNGIISNVVENVFVENNSISNCSGFGISNQINYLDYNNVWNNNINYANGAVQGEHAISFDPLFMKHYPHDYYPGISSPCINQGNPLSTYNDPDGSRNDIGAYYLNASASCVKRWIFSLLCNHL